jgi:hypothetical protein
MILVGDRTLQPAAEIGTLVEPGEVSVTISAAKLPAMHQNLACAAGAITFVHFPELSPPVAPVAPAPAIEPAATLATPSDARPPYRAFAIATAAFAGAAVITGGVLGIVANHRHDDAFALCRDPQIACDSAVTADDLIRSGHNLALEADVLFGIGAAAAITSGVLWYVAYHPTPSGVAIVPAASPNQLGLTAIGSF